MSREGIIGPFTQPFKRISSRPVQPIVSLHSCLITALAPLAASAHSHRRSWGVRHTYPGPINEAQMRSWGGREELGLLPIRPSCDSIRTETMCNGLECLGTSPPWPRAPLFRYPGDRRRRNGEMQCACALWRERLWNVKRREKMLESSGEGGLTVPVLPLQHVKVNNTYFDLIVGNFDYIF